LWLLAAGSAVGFCAAASKLGRKKSMKLSIHISTSGIASTSSTDSVPAMPIAADATLSSMHATAVS